MKAPISFLALLSITMALPIAQAQPATAGFSGEVSLLTLAIVTNSNLSTFEEQKNADLINSQGSTESKLLPAALVNLNYRYGDELNQRLFIGTSREDIAVGTVALEAGYEYHLAMGGKLSVSYLPTLISDKVWQDPYMLNTNRTETDLDGEAYRLQFKQMFGSPWSMDIAYANTDVAEEKSGVWLMLPAKDQLALRRSADNYYAKLSYRQMFGRSRGITPSLSYLRKDAQGDSMAFDELGAAISYFGFSRQHNLVTTLSVKTRDYDASNPIFDSKREDQELGLFVVYEYRNLFNIAPLSFLTLNGMTLTHSNIDFYQQRQFLASVGLNYRF